MANITDMKKTQGSAVAATANHPIRSKIDFLDKRKELLGAGIPGHMMVEREIRTATVMLMQSKDLQAASAESFYTAVSIAVNSGVGLGSGKGYLVAYKGNCQYVPGWKGLVDLVSRTGRGTVWTGIVHAGDHFDYALGDSPFLTHRPGDNEEHKDITHYYSIGRVKGSEWPIIEVWSAKKVIRHLNDFNKVGARHYALKDHNNMEMYGRKVTLLQVLKYMPQGQDLETAIEADRAAELNKTMTIDGDFMYIKEDDDEPAETQTVAQPATQVNRPAQPAQPAVKTVREVPEQQQVSEEQAGIDAFNKFSSRLANATDLDMLDADADLIRDFSPEDQIILKQAYAERHEQLQNPAPAVVTRAARPRPPMNLE